MERPLTVAVTGLNATDNPGPGVSVIRSLRLHPDFDGRIVGLAYDTLDPGIYARDLVDDVFIIPYPSQGPAALEARLRHIKERVGLDVVLPTLDSELASFIALEPVLEELDVGSFLPTHKQLDLRSKVHLSTFGESAGIKVPPSKVVSSVEDLYRIHEEVAYPFFIKGVYYGATLVRSVDEAVRAFHGVVARWGYPVIVQAFVQGDELDVVAVGDGEGGLVGALPMKKTFITDKGKGWAGIAIKDPELIELTRSFVAALNWRGPCEVEVIKDADGAYHLIEVNPRFPAWTYLSAGAGINLPYAVVRLAAGLPVEPMHDYEVGKMFVRISLDQIADLADFQAVTTHGELLSQRGED
ncbi:MAG: ATP-grasp domain-containing protein [Deltaproteobacteria bacterium]|nr:ATP-grasp domain-containing protein [Deltaproteobacteria bacterium]